MDEPLFAVHMFLTQSEITSLLMAQIRQTRHSCVTLGETNSISCIDKSALKKLSAARELALQGDQPRMRR